MEIGLNNQELCSPDDQGADGEDVEIGSHKISLTVRSLQQNPESYIKDFSAFPLS